MQSDYTKNFNKLQDAIIEKKSVEIKINQEIIEQAWVEVQTEPDQSGDFDFLYKEY